MALSRQTISIPISQGLDQKTDPFQVPAGKALALENVRFIKAGKLSKRFGTQNLSLACYDQGSLKNLTTLSIQRVISDEKQVNALTKDGIYSLTNDRWQKSSRYRDAAKVKSSFINKSAYNQYGSDCDISPDGKYIAYVYGQIGKDAYSTVLSLEDVSTGFKNSVSLIGALGQLLLQRVAFTKVGNSYFINLFYRYENSGVYYLAHTQFDINLTQTVAINTITTLPVSAQFDVCKDALNIFIVKIEGTAVNLYKRSLLGAAVSSATDTLVTGLYSSVNRAGGLSCVVSASNLHVAWVTNTGCSIIGYDKNLSPAIFAASFTLTGSRKVSINTTSTGLVLAASTDEDVTSGIVDRSIFYSITFTTSYATTLLSSPYRFMVLAQPFEYNGSLYCPVYTYDLTLSIGTGYIVNITNTYSAALVSPKNILNVPLVTGDYPTMVSKTIYKEIGSFDQIGNFVFSANKLFSPVSPYIQVIYTEFVAVIGVASFNARMEFAYSDGCRQKVGDSIYSLNGSLIEFDNRGPHENNFHAPASVLSAVENTGTANPNVASKKFSYLVTYEFIDGQGQITRSAPSGAYAITTGATAASITINAWTPPFTLKFGGSNGFTYSPNVVIYRTENNGSVYYRIISIPVTTNDGNYVSFVDTTADSSITDNERVYTTGGVIPNDPAPNGEFSAAGAGRIFIGGLEQEDEIAYSKKQLFGESVNFTDNFRIRIASGSNTDKTKISGIGYLDGKIIIFRQNSIYYISGDGPDELGQGDFSEPEIISSDAGCIDPRSVLSMPNGLMFKSRKGIYLLDRSLQVSYVGSAVEDYNNESIVASIVSDKFNECRFYTSGTNCLVYNYLFGAWSIFKNQTNLDADIWSNSPVIIRGGLVTKETENNYQDGAGYYSMKFTSPWLKLDLIQGYIRCYQLWIIGTFKSAHTLKCKVYVDYDDSTFDDYSLVYNGTDSPQYEFQISLPRQKVESIKFEIYDIDQAASGESFDLSNIQAEVGMKAGGYKLANTKTY